MHEKKVLSKSKKDQWINVTEYDNFIDVVSDPTLNCKKLPLVEFQDSAKEQCSLTFSEKAIKIVFPLPSTYLCETGFSLCTSTRTTYHLRLSAEARIKSLSSLKPDIKKIWKNVKQ